MDLFFSYELLSIFEMIYMFDIPPNDSQRETMKAPLPLFVSI